MEFQRFAQVWCLGMGRYVQCDEVWCPAERCVKVCSGVFGIKVC